jgi:hypothetical protein
MRPFCSFSEFAATPHRAVTSRPTPEGSAVAPGRAGNEDTQTPTTKPGEQRDGGASDETPGGPCNSASYIPRIAMTKITSGDLERLT